MITNVNGFRNSGFRIDSGIKDTSLMLSLNYAEKVILLHMIGATQLANAQALAPTNELIAGGDQSIGLAMALYYIAYSHLLLSDVMASTFGTVKKISEDSQPADGWRYAKMCEDVGKRGIVQFCENFGICYDDVSTVLNETL